MLRVDTNNEIYLTRGDTAYIKPILKVEDEEKCNKYDPYEFILKNEVSSVLSSVRSDISLSGKLMDKDPYRVKQTLNHDMDLLSEGIKELDNILKKLEQ